MCVKILTLKITDFNDSMYAKIFVKDDKDWDFYRKHIKKDAWYKFRDNRYKLLAQSWCEENNIAYEDDL